MKNRLIWSLGSLILALQRIHVFWGQFWLLWVFLREEETAAAWKNQAAAEFSVPTKLKITLNLGNVNTATAFDSTASTVVTAPSIDDEDDIWLRELTGENNSTIKKPQIQSQQQQIHQNDREMLLKVWQVIWSNYDSIP